jgi:hypothetical protein
MSGGGMSGASSGGGAAAGLLQCSQRGPLARDVTEEYSRGTHCMGTVRGYRRSTSLPWVRRSTAERPSPLRVCSALSNNELNGSVPSSLSALTNLVQLCVAPSCQRRLRVRGRGGSDRSALVRVRAACRGVHCMSGASSGGGAAAGLLRYSQRGLWARDVTNEYSLGHPSPMGYGTVGAHGCRGCGVAPPGGRVRFGCAAPSATMS